MQKVILMKEKLLEVLQQILVEIEITVGRLTMNLEHSSPYFGKELLSTR